MNPYYSYDSMFLWDDETWADRDAQIRPLLDKLTVLAHTVLRPLTKSDVYQDRTDGSYDPKSNVRLLPDVIAKWERLGMTVHITSMGFVSWIALVPKERSSSPQVLFVPHNCDMHAGAWAMQTLDFYENYGRLAAKDGAAVLLYCQDRPIPSGIFMDILLELSAIFHIGLEHLMLDLSILERAGEALPPDSFTWNGIPVLDMTDKWHSRVAHQYICSTLNKSNPEFDFERFKRSTLGRRIADSMRLEYDYQRSDDPALVAQWDAKGLEYADHFCRGERYMTLCPKQAREPMPLLLCMKEVRTVMPFQALTALQFYYEFTDIAACGEMMMLFFAMETPEDNDLLMDIIEQACAQYPIDRSRIYIIGQSHNGYLALEFARRHPQTIAAVAQLNDRHGIGAPRYSVDNVKMTDEMLAGLSAWDLPLINICGQIENVFSHIEPGTEAEANAIDSFHRRLKAFRCPDKSDQEIAACRTSADTATRMNGIPGDKSEVLYAMGHACYVSDVKNIDGNWHLRFVTLENLPHMITPQMAELAWGFMRRFARQPDGSILERY